MTPSAISHDVATNEHVISSDIPFHQPDGLISPPSTDNESLPDTNGHHHDLARSQMSAMDVKFHQPASDELHDLICVGFGPASLAIAIALHDKYGSLNSKDSTEAPKLCFLERQPQFAWHAGMQLPGAHMQISFLKDLATPRDPRSRFTFLNYLFHKGRLNQFINLSTFLPTRLEYEDYLRWCASHFSDVVSYGQEVLSIKPLDTNPKTGKTTSFSITSRDISTNEISTRRARHVVIAVGGKPNIPPQFIKSPRIIHSSNFSYQCPQILPNPNTPYQIAVIGSGQSAAEIFSDLQTRYPLANISLVIKSSALKPSDDSPFVNEIFDPDRVDGIYAQNPVYRNATIMHDRNTNYGVVREGLLEHLYEALYVQRVKYPDPRDWKIRILNQRQVVSSKRVKSHRAGGSENIELEIVGTPDSSRAGQIENMAFDAVFVATGYVRNAHEEMLVETKGLLPQGEERFPVQRNYRVGFDGEKVDGEAGVWLQGCNERTHGLSDTLLSILAVRSGELVDDMFGVRGD